jgi:hypothetical protein
LEATYWFRASSIEEIPTRCERNIGLPAGRRGPVTSPVSVFMQTSKLKHGRYVRTLATHSKSIKWRPSTVVACAKWGYIWYSERATVGHESHDRRIQAGIRAYNVANCSVSVGVTLWRICNAARHCTAVECARSLGIRDQLLKERIQG